MKQADKQLLQDIDSLIAKFQDPAYPNDLDDLKGTKLEAERVVFMKALLENEWLVVFLDYIRNDLREINHLLTEGASDKVNEVLRDSLIRMRKFYKNIISLLAGSDKEFEELRKRIDDEIENVSLWESQNRGRMV